MNMNGCMAITSTEHLDREAGYLGEYFDRVEWVDNSEWRPGEAILRVWQHRSPTADAGFLMFRAGITREEFEAWQARRAAGRKDKMGETTSATPERLDRETWSEYHLPVTLAEIESAGIELDGAEFGVDPAERAELLHDPEILRVRFGVTVDDNTDIHRFAEIEVLQARVGEPAAWTRCQRLYRSASGASDRLRSAQNNARVDALISSKLPDVNRLYEGAEAVHAAWIASLEA